MSLSRDFFILKKKLKPPASDENLARKLTFSIENNFMMQTQIDLYFYMVMLTDAQVYYMTSMIYLFRPPLTAKAIYRKTAEAKL